MYSYQKYAKVLQVLALIGLVASAPLWADQPINAARCQPQTADEPKLYNEDFAWNQSATEINERFQNLYDSGKRLDGRVYFDAEQNAFIAPVEVASTAKKKSALTPESFIQNVTRHIETAHRLRYADWLIFSDMGHSHFHIPQKVWEEKFAPIPAMERAQLYESLMQEPTLRVLYHLAEQLKTTDESKMPIQDRWLQWRHYTRNPVGYNDGKVDLEIFADLREFANTVREIPGHRLYSAGFNVSASKNGCFAYTDQNGETRYFDISYSDLASRSEF